MPPSNLATKTYTQPSCTLQIVDYNSPKSTRRGEIPNNQLQFELCFDDPQLLETQHITIQGDRQQLAELHEVVNAYLQGVLAASPEQFNAMLAAQRSQAAQAIVPPSQVSDSVALDVSGGANSAGDLPATPNRKIFLQSGGGLYHSLFLGPLATNETGQVIHLSTLQLFDLATVLDEYAASTLATPAFSRPRRAVSNPLTTWGTIAATLLLSIGLTTAVVQLLNRYDEEQQIANRASVPAPKSNDPSLSLKPSPTPGLSTLETLPSPPPLVTTSPSPTSNLPSGSIPSPTTPLPGTPLPIPQTNSIPTPPSGSTTVTTPISPLPGIAQAPPILSTSLPKQPEGAIPIPGQTAAFQPSRGTSLPGITPPTNIPNPSQNQIVRESAVLEASRSTTSKITEPPTQPTTEQRLQAALQRQSPSTPTPPSDSKTTALITTPQLSEVKEYFQNRWEPPSGLTQTLEYSIVLDVDGTIQRIEPLGRASRTYVDRSGMPLIGEPFVSPNTNGESPRIRVVLNPNGRVQTFLEQEQGQAAQASPKKE